MKTKSNYILLYLLILGISSNWSSFQFQVMTHINSKTQNEVNAISNDDDKNWGNRDTDRVGKFMTNVKNHGLIQGLWRHVINRFMTVYDMIAS